MILPFQNGDMSESWDNLMKTFALQVDAYSKQIENNSPGRIKPLRQIGGGKFANTCFQVLAWDLHINWQVKLLEKAQGYFLNEKLTGLPAPNFATNQFAKTVFSCSSITLQSNTYWRKKLLYLIQLYVHSLIAHIQYWRKNGDYNARYFMKFVFAKECR